MAIMTTVFVTSSLQLMKAAMSEFNEIARGNVSEDDIARGK